MTPTGQGSESAPLAGESPPGPVPVERPEYYWYHKMYAVLFVTFCLEIGIFLLVFPWTDYWEMNYFSGIIPGWRQYWDNMYVRGAISGLGAMNLYIAFVEAFRLRRFARS
jgi:hypothetical protein